MALCIAVISQWNDIMYGIINCHNEIQPFITIKILLLGGLEHVSCFHMLEISSPQLTFIFFRGVGIPPTSFSFVHKWKISMFCMFLCGLPKIDHVMIFDDIRWCSSRFLNLMRVGQNSKYTSRLISMMCVLHWVVGVVLGSRVISDFKF